MEENNKKKENEETMIHINKQYEEPEDDYEEDEIDEEPIFIREKNSFDYSKMVWILGILAFLVFIGFGYSKGWFSSIKNNTESSHQSGTATENKPFAEAPKNPAPIESVSIETSGSFPLTKTLVLKGTFANGCGYLADPIQNLDGNLFTITLETRPVETDAVCTEALVPFERKIDLMVKNLPAGIYNVRINGQHEIQFTLEGDNRIDFTSGEAK